MNIKVKAAGITAGIFISTIAVVEILRFVLDALTPDQVLSILGYGSISLLIWMFYKLVLTNLEHKESIQKIRDTK